MMNDMLLQTITRAVEQLDDARDMLLKGSHDSVKADNEREWQLAERFFTLARNVDALRREAVSLIEILRGGAKTRMEVPQEDSKKMQKSLKKRKEDYPTYAVRGDQLIKKGLSRDRKSEYEHAVPKPEFERIVEKLARLRAIQQEFKSEDVQEGLELPVYQTYAVLSLLRHLGLIEQRRRGFYSFNSKALADASTIWRAVAGGA